MGFERHCHITKCISPANLIDTSIVERFQIYLLAILEDSSDNVSILTEYNTIFKFSEMKELYNAYLSLAICEMVMKMTNRKCLGCLHNRRVHLNHIVCKQTSLLEKFEQHCDQALVKVMGDLKMIVIKITTIYPV